MNKTLKKTLSIIITILMIVTSVPVSFAADDVNYIECSWDGTKVVHTPKSVSSYTVVEKARLRGIQGGMLLTVKSQSPRRLWSAVMFASSLRMAHI